MFMQTRLDRKPPLTEVVRTPQLLAGSCGVGAAGVSMNSNDSSEGALPASDILLELVLVQLTSENCCE